MLWKIWTEISSLWLYTFNHPDVNEHMKDTAIIINYQSCIIINLRKKPQIGISV